jgi:hypothetical protein
MFKTRQPALLPPVALDLWQPEPGHSATKSRGPTKLRAKRPFAGRSACAPVRWLWPVLLRTVTQSAKKSSKSPASLKVQLQALQCLGPICCSQKARLSGA